MSLIQVILLGQNISCGEPKTVHDETIIIIIIIREGGETTI